MRTVRALVVPVLVLPVVLGACSSDSDPGAASSATAAAPASLPLGSVPTPTFEAESPELGSCAETAVAYNAAFNQVSVLITGGTSEQFAAAQQQFADLQGRVPPELATDFGAVYDSVIAFSAKAGGANLSTPEGVRALAEAGQDLNAQPVLDANNRIDDWFRIHCAEPTAP